MAVVMKSLSGCLFLLMISLLMVGVVFANATDDDLSIRVVETEMLQNMNMSSMEARAKKSEYLNEKAVQNPEEVVSMVEMYDFYL
ncbi:AmbAllergen [Artemisia annua]|uniref:AmbAllergen n=1 Tax=Artemisia annua TaxID=35608 RepID=A0A2U1KXA6_ARTAN|nr:AmbAllergen [Artemisia annua]